MSYRGESRGRGISNAPAWMTRGRENDHTKDAPRDGPRDAPRDAPRDGLRDGPAPRDHLRRQPPQRYDPRYDRPNNRDRDDRRRGGGGGGGGGRSSSSRRRTSSNRSGIYFQSYEEERAWVEERRKRRHERKSLFDVTPTEEQLALEELQKAALASSGPNPNVFLRPEEMKVKQSTDLMIGMEPANLSNLPPQQTRHARRLYIGNLPVDLTENDVHDFFRSAIHTAMGEDKNSEDHITSVYINRERRFSFLEFKSIDICTACLALDGIDVCGKGKVKVKRPNDYNPGMVPPGSNPAIIQKFDASKLGIVCNTVPDSPNKIFIGGLPYHLSESDVLELLTAFGEVKAFHLVKADALAATSKGYCFVEYVDENVKNIAVMGLNGMDMGNGKQLSAKVATASSNSTSMSGAPVVTSSMSSIKPIGDALAPRIMKVVDGVDIEALLDIAMGSSVPTSTPSLSGTTGVLDIANKALAAASAYGF